MAVDDGPWGFSFSNSSTLILFQPHKLSVLHFQPLAYLTGVSCHFWAAVPFPVQHWICVPFFVPAFCTSI